MGALASPSSAGRCRSLEVGRRRLGVWTTTATMDTVAAINATKRTVRGAIDTVEPQALASPPPLARPQSRGMTYKRQNPYSGARRTAARPTAISPERPRSTIGAHPNSAPVLDRRLHLAAIALAPVIHDPARRSWRTSR